MTKELPQQFTGSSAWVTADLASDSSAWLKEIVSLDVKELEVAAKRYLDTGKNIGEITVDDFMLPEFSKYLQRLKRKLITGTVLKSFAACQ